MVSFFKSKKTTFRSAFANNSVLNIHFMKVSTENDNNFGHEKNMIVVDNMPLNEENYSVLYKPKRYTIIQFSSTTNYAISMYISAN